MQDFIEISSSRALITAGWDDVPHLSEEKKRQLIDSTPKHMRDARTKGIPSLGAGAIYPIPEEDIITPPMAIPDYWPRGYAMDVGWNATAALWMAQDPTDGTCYLYSEYKKGGEIPAVHAQAVKSRGEWIKGAVDPAARASSQADGKRLKAMYGAAGLNLVMANNEVDAGIYKVYVMLSTGQLKVFSTLRHFFDEYRLYRRERKINEFGVERYIIIKKNDHLMDTLRYLVMTFDSIKATKPAPAHSNMVTGAGDSIVGY